MRNFFNGSAWPYVRDVIMWIMFICAFSALVYVTR
jgi:hypothetical protein